MKFGGKKALGGGRGVRINTRALTLTAVLGAMGAVLLSLNFSLPFVPPFLEFDVAEFPSLFAGFFMGPVSGAAVIVIKNLLKYFIQGSATFGIGELSNVIVSLAFTLPAAIIYRRRRDVKTARFSLIVAILTGAAVSVVMNLYVSFPMYARVLGVPLESIIGMGSAVNPLINNLPTLIVFGVLPFNLIKLSATSFVTWQLYKRLGTHLRSLTRVSETDRSSMTQ